jgi:hypothetical protein
MVLKFKAQFHHLVIQIYGPLIVCKGRFMFPFLGVRQKRDYAMNFINLYLHTTISEQNLKNPEMQ